MRIDAVEGRGPWMQTSTGRQFFPGDPRPEDICLSDIANGLAMDCRYAGQVQIDRFYSVAEHSGLMALYALQYHLPAGAAMVALLHDAHEAYTRDLPRAVKKIVGSAYKQVAERVQGAVWDHFALVSEAVEHELIVRELDERIVATEKIALMRHQRPWAADELVPLPVMVRCLPPAAAKKFFVQVYWQCCLKMGTDPEEVEI